jgi:hypothetical protein
MSPRVSSVARPVEFQEIYPQYIPMIVSRKLEVGLCFSNKTLGAFCVPVFQVQIPKCEVC